MIAKVAVEHAAFSFDDAFDYSIPETLKEKVRPGVRVLVPFGKSSKKRQGVVFALREKSEAKKLKAVAEVCDEQPLLSGELLRLAAWMKERYFCTLFEAAKAMLPTGLGLQLVISYAANPELSERERLALDADEAAVYAYLCEKCAYVREDRLLKTFGYASDSPLARRMAEKGSLISNVDSVRRLGDATVKTVRLSEAYFSLTTAPKLTVKQKSVVRLLEEIGSASVKEVCYFTGVTAAVLVTLEKRGLVELFDGAVFRRPRPGDERGVRDPIELTEEQKRACETLSAQYRERKASCALLFGVTGSGKTQVYMKLIDSVLADGRGVIVMVPEIALTPQLMALFYGRYGGAVALFHSALPMGERMDEWKRVKEGKAKIAVGTRSAVFAPFDDLGLIIMDEEQEHSYKSEMSPRYQAREAAKFRAGIHGALLLLTSATPSLVTYAAAKNGRCTLCTLKNRYGGAVLPEVVVSEMKYGADPLRGAAIGKELRNALRETLNAKKQAILLLNRRGYNTFAMCSKCGKVMTCPNCSISLTYHSVNHRLMCHYCGYSEPFTSVCPSCGADGGVLYTGTGTQRLEEELKASFPDARVLRMDTDAASSRNSFEKALKKFTNCEYDVMLGTQMVAKGLDFPNVTLVGVISVDQQLYNDDYKSAERAFDLLMQVVGRAGRGDFHGKAIIQTSFPENEIIRLAAKQDYETFYGLELGLRKALVYPPYCDLCTLTFVGVQEPLVRAASKFMFGLLRERHGAEYKDQPVIVLGPIAPRLARIAGKYRYRIIVKCRNSKRFRQMIAELLKTYAKESRFSAVSVVADIDPEDIY